MIAQHGLAAGPLQIADGSPTGTGPPRDTILRSTGLKYVWETNYTVSKGLMHYSELKILNLNIRLILFSVFLKSSNLVRRGYVR